MGPVITSDRPEIWRRLAEGLMLAYLLTMPAGPALPWWGRDPLLYGVIVCGVLDAALGPARGAMRGLLPVGVFLGVHALTVFTSADVSLSMNLSVFTPVVAMLFIVWQRVLVTPGAFDRLYAALGLVGALIAVDGCVQVLFGFSPVTFESGIRWSRARASLPHPNDLVLVPVLLPFAFEALRRRGWRWLAAGVVLIGPPVAVVLLASKSRNAWLTTAGVALVWSWLVLGWRWAAGAVAAVGALGAGLYAADLFGARARAGDFLRLHRDGRIGVWLVAWEMFRESPLLGKGVFTFTRFYNDPVFMEKVSFPEGYEPERGTIPWAHSLPLEMLSERGLAGFASFVWMIAAAVWSAGRRAGKAAGSFWAGLREPRTAAGVTSLAGFLGASLIDLTLMKDWVVLVLFLLLAVLWRVGDVADSGGDGGAQKKAPA